MNSESTNPNTQFHSWPFFHLVGTNCCRLPGSPLPSHGLNPSGFTLPPQYVQFVNALRFPLLFPHPDSDDERRKNAEANLEEERNRGMAPHAETQSCTQSQVESPTSSDFDSAANYESSIFPHRATEVEKSSTFCPFSVDVEEKQESGPVHDVTRLNRPSDCRSVTTLDVGETPEAPFLKFGVQAILSHAPPTTADSQSRTFGGENYLTNFTNINGTNPSPVPVFPFSLNQMLENRFPILPWFPPGLRGRNRRGMLRRAVFSDLQRKTLETTFQEHKYIGKPERKKLASKLGLKDSQVKIWFQNRRMKWRNTKEREVLTSSSSSQSASSTTESCRIADMNPKYSESVNSNSEKYPIASGSHIRSNHI